MPLTLPELSLIDVVVARKLNHQRYLCFQSARVIAVLLARRRCSGTRSMQATIGDSERMMTWEEMD